MKLMYCAKEVSGGQLCPNDLALSIASLHALKCDTTYFTLCVFVLTILILLFKLTVNHDLS